MPKHLLADQIEIISNGYLIADYQLEDFVELFGEQRCSIQLSTPLRRDSRLDIEIGDTLTLKWPRFGWGDGKSFLVIGVQPQPQRHTIQLTLWG
jgi:hypothetical protein